MKQILINTAPILVWILAVTEAITVYVCIRNSRNTLNRLASFVSFGLAIDAAIIALGVIIGKELF